LSPEKFRASFARDAHAKFVLNLDKETDTFEYYVAEHLRMSGVYWGLMAMDLIGKLHDMPRKNIVEWCMQCYDADTGGFSGNVGHDVHLLYTLSALQILALCDALDRVDKEKVAAYVAALQQPDGSFVGDQWGEVDTRFSYCALNALALLGPSATARIDVPKAVEFVARCRNFDGGFGAVPGAESHAGQIFCCVAALALAGPKALQEVDAGLLGWWLAERQLPTGGLNGRPEKKQDTCYSWWVLSALAIVGHADWIDGRALGAFILDCQDHKSGGISDRPGNMTDVFHTYFGLAGLSLLGYPDLGSIDPVYALPTRVVAKLNLPNRFQPQQSQQQQAAAAQQTKPQAS
jgi:geranylgeranyl transferase type-2 subunit beta